MTQHIFTSRCTLFRFDAATSQYKDLGEAGCAIVASPEDNDYRLGCYNASGKYLCIARIAPSNETGLSLALQGEYVSFRDENSAFWSVSLGSEATARLLCAHVTVAMFGCAGEPKENVVVCDATAGNGTKTVFAGDAVSVAYEYWVVQAPATESKVPTLGSKLESSLDRPYSFTVPTSHFNVAPTMKGFESLVVGMHEGGKRFAVVPVSLRKGNGPSVSLCYFIDVTRKKGAAPNPELPQITDIPASHSAPSNLSSAGRRETSTPAASSGFNQEQFLLVDRLRDEVFTLTQQLREARQQLGSFASSVKRHEASSKPKSLSSAQLQYSLSKLLTESDDAQVALEEKKNTVSILEERHQELLKQCAKFKRTAEELESTKLEAVNSTGEERIDLDSQIVNTQSQLERVQAELDDLSRQLQSTKALIEATEKDVATTKSDLQVALIAFRTTETKVSHSEEQAAEEQERRAQVASQLEMLHSTLQGLREELQAKEQQCESRVQKMNSDAAYYSGLLEKERALASSELREVRQELLNEIATRERLHETECERISEEAHQRGLMQGTEDGRSDGVLEVDQACRAMKQTIARTRAEERALQMRLAAGLEENDWAARTSSKELDHLRRSLQTVTAENDSLAAAIDALQMQRRVTEESVFSCLYEAISEVSDTVLPLPFVVAVLQHNKAPSAAFDEQVQRMRAGEEEEHHQILAWVRARVYSKPALMPPLRFPTASLDLVDETAAVRTAMDARYTEVLNRLGAPEGATYSAAPPPEPSPEGAPRTRQKSFPPPFVQSFSAS